jgi:RimJ/RimL family protein N-acetyltransferase
MVLAIILIVGRAPSPSDTAVGDVQYAPYNVHTALEDTTQALLHVAERHTLLPFVLSHLSYRLVKEASEKQVQNEPHRENQIYQCLIKINECIFLCVLRCLCAEQMDASLSSDRLNFFLPVGEWRDALLDYSVVLYSDLEAVKYLGFLRGMGFACFLGCEKRKKEEEELRRGSKQVLTVTGMTREQVQKRLEWRESRGGNSMVVQTKDGTVCLNLFLTPLRLFSLLPPVHSLPVIISLTRKNIAVCGFNSVVVEGEAEFGLVIDSKFWRKGFGAEIHLACFEYAFSSLGVKKIIMETDSENLPMRGFCERFFPFLVFFVVVQAKQARGKIPGTRERGREGSLSVS